MLFGHVSANGDIAAWSRETPLFTDLRQEQDIERTNAALKRALGDFKQMDLTWIQPPPDNDGWTLALDALQFLVSLMQHAQPQHVLEFGSGLSTRVLASACSGLSHPCAISSVDHDPEFGRPTGVCEDGKLRLGFQLAPLVARDCGGKYLPIFLLDPQRLASPLPVDIVVVDGPPVALGGREGTLYQAMEFARPGTLVLLDDAHRLEERVVLRRWQESLGDAIEVQTLPGFVKGMAAVVVRKPVPRSRLWDHRLRLTILEFIERVPPGEKIVVAGPQLLSELLVPERRQLPFLEREGQYWGAPSDDNEAIEELERLRREGAGFFAFTWPAFWWLDHYIDFGRYLRAHHACLVENDRLVLFDLRVEAGPEVEDWSTLGTTS